MILFEGCKNPFATRNPEPPKNAQSKWTQPLHPEDVLANLRDAVSERDAGNFVRCLSDAAYGSRKYRFEPDPHTAALYPEIFGQWDRDKEQAVMKQVFSLIPADSACMLTWTGSVREFTSSDSAIFVRMYRLELHHKQDNLRGIYEGQAEFWLTENGNGEWAIYRWNDNNVSGFPSWSVLKASLGG